MGYVGQKNKILSLASHDWIFSLDADEELSAQLRAEISAIKQSEVDAREPAKRERGSDQSHSGTADSSGGTN